MDYQALRSLPEMFFQQAARLAEKPFLWSKQDGTYRPLSYGDAGRRANLLARGLIDLGVTPGDRIALVAENRPEWLIADHAIMAAGGITVPAFTTNTPADHKHVLTHSGAGGAIISGKAIANRFLPAALESPELRFIVTMEALDLAQEPPVQVLGWGHVLAQGARRDEGEVDERVSRLRRSDPCCFIYTSGTGGTPKGVVLTHGSILCNLMGCYRLLQDFSLGDEVFLSFLPLSHSYEHTAGQFLPVSLGAQIYYAESIDRLLDNLAEARPTLMLAVPRLYEVMHQRIARATEKASNVRRRLFDRAVALGRQRYERPRSLSLSQRLQDRLVDRLVRDKVRQRFGGRLKAMISGGAALNTEIGLFFTALGIRLLQGYGQTETSPIVSVNPPRKVKLHTVGPPLAGIEVTIAADGEILVRGESVMHGYWRDPAATASAIRDGWLHTGDIGELSEDGFLRITDRKKDLIKTSGGKYVAPTEIEGQFKALCPFVSNILVHGAGRNFCSALIALDEPSITGWAKDNGLEGKSYAEIVGSPQVRELIDGYVRRLNQDLQRWQTIKKFAILPRDLDVEHGELTPSLKLKRPVVEKEFSGLIDEMYAGSREA